MHAEWGCISPQTADALNAARAKGGRIVAVGTTSLRLLESAAAEDGTIQPFAGETSIFITPGYRFRAVDILLTNFHLPRSTLFMLVSAFSGLDTMKRAYAHAISEGYRFYSYGDACLLFRGHASDAPSAAPRLRRRDLPSPAASGQGELHCDRHGRARSQIAPSPAPDSVATHRASRHHPLRQQFRDLDRVQRGALQKLVRRHEHRDRVAAWVAEVLADAADQHVVLA